MFHMLPSDSKRVEKTAARLFQSGGLEVGGRWLGGEDQRGIGREWGGSGWGEEGRPWLLGWVEVWGWAELAQTDPRWPDQTVHGDRGQSKLLPGWVPGP